MTAAVPSTTATDAASASGGRVRANTSAPVRPAAIAAAASPSITWPSSQWTWTTCPSRAAAVISSNSPRVDHMMPSSE